MLGQKSVVRENIAMRYFFSLSFRKSQLFQARSPRVAQLCSTSTLLPLPQVHLCSSPCPGATTLKRPLGSSYMGWGPCSRWTPPHGPTQPRICSVCHFVFSQHWNREAKINSQTDTKQRDRETAIQRPVTEKDGVRVGVCPLMARPLNGWNQVFSHSLTLG